MLPPQVIVVEEVLPEVRRRMAIALYSGGMSQERISDLLGTSQAMVSRYLKEGGERSGSLSLMVERISRELVVAASAGDGPEELTKRFCMDVEDCLSQGLMDVRYRERTGRDLPRNCIENADGEGGRFRVLEDLSTAARFLRMHPIPDLVPALKVNLAHAAPGAENTADVASFPGRLPDRRGMIQDPFPPEFGASKHLATVLLAAVKGDQSVRSVISLRYNDEIGSGLEKMGSRPLILDRSVSTVQELLSGNGPGGGGAVVDPGDFGIEPCLYLFGSSPLEVSLRTVELQSKMRDGGEMIETE